VSPPFVLAAGGTGGHVFPAEALAGELLAHGCNVHLLCDDRADSFARRIPEVEFHRVRAGRFGGGPGHAVYGLAGMAMGIMQARRLLRRLAPGGVIGFGGYASVPTMLAAGYLGLPTIIHEQNAVLGRANRLLAPQAQRIATGFPATSGLRPADRLRVVHTGNPVRSAILDLADAGYSAPEPGRPIELLILGGSQGAHVLGEIVPPAVTALPAGLRGRLRISQQVRPEDRAVVAAIYQQNGIAAELDSFFADVPMRLCRAHLVICRAGASTVAELAALGRPAILIPYPYAADDHQTANAHAFAEAGGGWLVPQPSLAQDVLSRRIENLLTDHTALTAAAAAAARFGRHDAAQRLARLVLNLDPGAAHPTDLAGHAA
jgi:UDP-N-acetylglucosamine--N-acetylmuramyl-(pentapeptide) pyrophosphoryl-undecaprenol N-acetylglucosamine transferase